MKKQTKIALLICFLFLALGFFSVEGFRWNNLKYTGEAITSDEVSHIPSGYYYLKTGRYLINPEHPPVVKDISALPLLVMNPTLPAIRDDIELNQTFTVDNKYPYPTFDFSRNLELENSQWDWGRIFLFNPSNNPDKIAFWARLSVLFFNSLFLFLLYVLITKVWNSRAGLIGIFLIAFSPFSIAHGSLVTMDFMSAIVQIIAIVAFSLYLRKFVNKEQGIWKSFFVAAFFIALAMVTKFSSVIIIPVMFLAGFLFVAFRKKSLKEIIKYIFLAVIIGAISLFLISLFYYLHVRNMDSGEVLMQINYNYPREFPAFGKGILSSLAVFNPLTMALTEYLIGVMMVFSRMSDALQFIYFLGNTYRSEGAGPGYFPFLYLVKLPIGLILLNLLALVLASIRLFFSKDSLKEKLNSFLISPLSLILFSFAYLYMLSSLSSNLQIGLRHIFPVIVAVSLLTAKCISNLWNKNLFKELKIKHLFGVAAVSIIITVAWSFPDYLPYYNLFVGGTDNGYKIATDSNYDWGGQDVKRLADWVQKNNIPKVYAHIFTNVPLEYYLGDKYEHFNIEWQDLPASGSYIAVSASELQNNIYNKELSDNKKYSILKDGLVARVGKSIFIFKVK